MDPVDHGVYDILETVAGTHKAYPVTYTSIKARTFLDDLTAAWVASDAGQLPDPLPLYAFTPSAIDDTVAPPGHHTIYLACPAAPARIAGGWAGRVRAGRGRCRGAWGGRHASLLRPPSGRG